MLADVMAVKWSVMVCRSCSFIITRPYFSDVRVDDIINEMSSVIIL